MNKALKSRHAKCLLGSPSVRRDTSWITINILQSIFDMKSIHNAALLDRIILYNNHCHGIFSLKTKNINHVSMCFSTSARHQRALDVQAVCLSRADGLVYGSPAHKLLRNVFILHIKGAIRKSERAEIFIFSFRSLLILYLILYYKTQPFKCHNIIIIRKKIIRAKNKSKNSVEIF